MGNIKEVKGIEELMRDSEHAHKVLIDNLPQKIFLKDINSVYIYCNRNYARDLKIKPEEIVGKTDYNFYPKDLAEKYRTDNKRIMESGKIEDIDDEYIQDGKSFFVHTTKVPVRDTGGKVVALLSIFWDITEQKKIELAVEESEARLRTVLNAVEEGIALSDEKGHFYLYNPAMERLTGYTMEEANSYADFSRLIYPDSNEWSIAFSGLAELIAKGTRRNVESKIVSKGGQIKHVLMSSYLINYKNQKMFLTFYKDITERKRIEEALRQNENYLKTIFNFVQTGVMIVDPETRKIIDVNPVIIKAFGADRDKIVGAICHQYICPAEKGKCPIIDLGQTVDNAERVLVKANGERMPVIKTVVPIILNNRKFLLESFTDITEQKKAETQLKETYLKLQEAQTQLIQAEKLSAIGRLASGIAHEVKNPIQIILQGINYLEGKDVLSDKNAAQVIHAMKKNINRADNIIRPLLDFSRASELKIEPEDPNRILEGSLALIYHEALAKNIHIIKELGKGLPRIAVDKRKMEQVFVNILLNAVQAMPADGNLYIRSYLTKLEKVRFRVGRRKADGDYFTPGEEAVVAEIEDTGIGIPKENLNKIFDPFFTTKEPGEGVGLGLSVTQNIVDMHRGIIEIESEINKGTKVFVMLKIFDKGE